MTDPLTDPFTLVGGGSIFAGMVVAFTFLVRRLTAQDTGWQAIVEQQTSDIRELRADLTATRLELAAARLQIAELQHWGAERDH